MAATNNNPGSNPNQLNEKELKRLIELLQKIDKLTEAAATNQANQAQLVGNARQQLDRFEKELKDITGDVSYVSVGFSKMLEDIKNSNEGLNESLKAYRGLRSLTDEIQYYQKGISNMSERDVSKQRERLESEKTRLENANKLLDGKQKELESSKKLNEEERKHLINVIVNLNEKKQKQGGLNEEQKATLKQTLERTYELKSEYKSIGEQLKKNNSTLEQNTAILNNFDAYAEGLELTLQKITKEIKQQNVENLDKQFKNIVKETSSTDENLSKITKSFSSLTSLAQKVQDHQFGISKLSEKEVKTALKQLEIENKTFLKVSENLKKEQAHLEGRKDANTLLSEQTKQQIISLETQKQSGQWDDDKAQSLEELYELQKKQTKTSEELNDKILLNKTAQDKVLSVITNQSEAYNTLRSDLNKISKDVKINLINNVDEGFKNVVEEIQSTEDGIKKLTRSFTSITSIAQQIQDHQNGINKLNEKDVKKLIEKLNTEKKLLIANYESFKIQQKDLKNEELSNKASLATKKLQIDALKIKEDQNTLSADETTELEQHRKEYQSLLEKQDDIVSELKITETATEKISELIRGQNKEYNEIRATLNKIAVEAISKIDEGFKNVVNDISSTDQISKSMTKSFENLSGISQKLQEYQENIADVSKEDIEELIKKVELEKQSFTRNLKLLDLEKQRLEASSTTNKETLRNIDTEINALQNKSTLTEDEKNNLIELEIKKANLIESEDEITRKLETNSKLTEKTQEYISGQNEEYQKLNDTLNDTNKRVNNINKSFGLNIGKNLKGALGKAGLGNLANMLGIDDATKKMAKLTAKYTDNGKKALTFGQQFRVMGSGLMSMGGNLLKGFNPWMLALTGIIKLVQFFIDAMFDADKQVTNIARSFVISKDAAREVRNRFSEIINNGVRYNDLLGNQLLNQKELVEANLKINEILGTSVDLSSQLGEGGVVMAREFAIASKFLKLSEEEAQGLLKQFLISNKEIKNTDNGLLQISKRILGTTSLYKLQNGVLISERKVLENVLKASNAIKLSVKGGVEGLTKAAIEATRLGLSLQKVSDIGDGLLDFETSITAELEAELLLGKSFNLEKARLAALNNDFETLASEIRKEVGTAEEFSKLNRIQQSALAKMFNMQKDEFADMLVEQESLNKLKGEYQKLGADAIAEIQRSGKLTAEQLKTLKEGKGTALEYYQALKNAGKSTTDITEALGNVAYQALSSQDAQEKFNEALEKAKETFSRFVDGGSLDKLADFITRFVTSVEQKGLWDTLTGGLMSTSEVEELQSQKQAESLDKQIAEKKARGEDTSQLEEQRKGVSADQTKQQYLKSLEYKPAEGDIDQMLFGKSNLQQKAAGETYLIEDITRIVDNLFGGFAGIQADQERRTLEAQQQLEEAKKQYNNTGTTTTKGGYELAPISKKFAMGGYTGDGDKNDIAGLVHKGEYVINQDQTKKYKPLLEKINNGEPLLDTINGKEIALDKKALNVNQTTNKTSNLNAVNALDKTNLTNLVVNAENVNVTTSKTSKETTSNVSTPSKILSKITDLFTGKSEIVTKTNDLTNSLANKTDLTSSILNTSDKTQSTTSSQTSETFKNTEENYLIKIGETVKNAFVSGVNDIIKNVLNVTQTNTALSSLNKTTNTSSNTTSSSQILAKSIDKLNVSNLATSSSSSISNVVKSTETNKISSSEDMVKNISVVITNLTENTTLLNELLKKSLIVEPSKPKGLLETTLQGGMEGGVGGALFGVVSHLMEPHIEPISPSIETSNINTANNNNSTLVTNNQNVNSNDEVVKTLREAVAVLKAIQTKDTNVQLSLDGEVVAKKLSPYTPKYLMTDFSTIS